MLAQAHIRSQCMGIIITIKVTFYVYICRNIFRLTPTVCFSVGQPSYDTPGKLCEQSKFPTRDNLDQAKLALVAFWLGPD